MTSTIKNAVKIVLAFIFRIFNLFYYPFLKRYFFLKIRKIPRSTQLFFINRLDLGPNLLSIHYAKCWQQMRGPVCLIILTAHQVAQLSKLICPNATIIHFENFFSKILLFIFKAITIQEQTLNRIFIHATNSWPYALYMFDSGRNYAQSAVSCYISTLDPILQKDWPFSNEFLNTYLSVNEALDYRRPRVLDWMQLHYQSLQKPSTQAAKSLFQGARQLLKDLKIDSPYVIINLNCKNYKHTQINSRRINFPERYNSLIDLLISKGYSVVFQGRDEQPDLPSRKGLIKYFKTSYVSMVNDYKLFANCSFAIFSKTGPEAYGPICNIPMLGLNYTELLSMAPNGRSRFFPKHLWDSKNQEFIDWRNFLKRPCYYNIHTKIFEDGIEYIDLNEEEILMALNEFLPLLQQPDPLWLNYTPLQKEFRRALHPAHLDLFEIVDVPCDSYLSLKKQA